jgi:hypothetical protein
MRQPLYIPAEVREAISQHLRSAVDKAVRVFSAGAEEEDALTGQLGMALMAPEQEVLVTSDGVERWRWSMGYTKFRGRGKGAAENILGADGIFELQLRHAQGIEQKSAMFQAKTKWDHDPSLFEQCAKLSTWREAAFVVDYRPEGFEVHLIDAVIRSRGAKSAAGKGVALSEFLANVFIACKVGDNDLSYDRDDRTLTWRARDGTIVATKFTMGRRFRITVKSPRAKEHYDKLVRPDEAYRYRMDASPQDILNLPELFTKTDLAKAKREAAKTFHPDQMGLEAPPLAIKILNLRMQEQMEAEQFLAEELKQKRAHGPRRKR